MQEPINKDDNFYAIEIAKEAFKIGQKAFKKHLLENDLTYSIEDLVLLCNTDGNDSFSVTKGTDGLLVFKNEGNDPNPTKWKRRVRVYRYKDGKQNKLCVIFNDDSVCEFTSKSAVTGWAKDNPERSDDYIFFVY